MKRTKETRERDKKASSTTQRQPKGFKAKTDAPRKQYDHKAKASSSTQAHKRKADYALQHSSPANKKRALKLSRQAYRPNADIVIASKEIWNKLRMRDNTPEQISTLMANLMTLLTGKFAQIACKHDASRVVQAALQFANESQRSLILQELCAPVTSATPESTTLDDSKRLKKTVQHTASHLVQLSTSQYAHFIVVKMIKLCESEPENIKAMVKV